MFLNCNEFGAFALWGEYKVEKHTQAQQDVKGIDHGFFVRRGNSETNLKTWQWGATKWIPSGADTMKTLSKRTVGAHVSEMILRGDFKKSIWYQWHGSQ